MSLLIACCTCMYVAYNMTLIVGREHIPEAKLK